MLKRATFRDLRRDRRGNMLMIFAFSIIPITFATGMGIDYAGAMRLQTRLNAVADAASLAAVTAPMMKDTIGNACVAARATFESQVGGVKGLTIDTRTPAGLTITVTDTYQTGGPTTITCPATGRPVTPAALPLTRQTIVKYAARSANNFAGILGRASLGIGGTATAKTIVAPFIDIHLALDTSQSMGLAATDEEAVRLWQATTKLNGRGCQFGCHSRDPKEKYSMEAIARMTAEDGKPYARMRIDVLRDATIDIIETARKNQGLNRSYQFALYRIGKVNGRWNLGIDEYVPLTDDLIAVRGSVSSLSLGPNDGSVGFGDTDLPAATDFVLPKIRATSATYDDGTTKARARKFLFMVTDGVKDTEGNCNGGYRHCTAPIDPTSCNAYKQKGVTVGIVYTTFLPVKANPLAKPTDRDFNNLRPEYRDLVQPFADKIRPNLEKCATPGWFFEASDGPAIHTAMTTLFRQATQTPSIIR